MEATLGSDEQEILPPLFLAEESQVQEETHSEPSTPSEVLRENLKQSVDVIELNSKLEIEKKRRAKVILEQYNNNNNNNNLLMVKK